MRSYGRTTPAEPPPDIRLNLRIGRLRRLEAGVVLLAGCVAGWLWMGNSGAALLLLWGWSRWPRWRTRTIIVPVSRLRFSRLRPSRVMWAAWPLHTGQAFIDELSAEQYAALRRGLKSAVR